MPNTTRAGLPYPHTDNSDAPQGPAEIQALAAALDAITALFGQGTHAAKPAAGTDGRFYWETDTSTLWWDDGTTWHEVDASTAIAKALGTTKGDLIVFTGAGVAVRFAVGTDGYALTADSTQASGLNWKAGGPNAARMWAFKF